MESGADYGVHETDSVFTHPSVTKRFTNMCGLTKSAVVLYIGICDIKERVTIIIGVLEMEEDASQIEWIRAAHSRGCKARCRRLGDRCHDWKTP